MPLLELNAVCKSYGFGAHRTDVLRDINLQIHVGEFVAIVGYSGVGKTTLMWLMAGLIKPDSGTITLDGQPVTGPGPDRAMVFQNYALLPWLTVYENVALAVQAVFPDWTPDQQRAHVEKYIAMVNLAPARDQRPRELSGGMRQRVSVARALAMRPRILLLDEPLGALDALTRARLQDEIARIWTEDKTTVVLITNDVEEGIYLADRMIPLSTGPGAFLGPSVEVEIDRPRLRKALNHEPRFKMVRREILDFLLESGARHKTAVVRKLVLPNIEPEDLSQPRSLFGGRRAPIRRSEIKSEPVEHPQ